MNIEITDPFLISMLTLMKFFGMWSLIGIALMVVFHVIMALISRAFSLEGWWSAHAYRSGTGYNWANFACHVEICLIWATALSITATFLPALFFLAQVLHPGLF